MRRAALASRCVGSRWLLPQATASSLAPSSVFLCTAHRWVAGSSSPSSTLAEEMKSKGFVNPTPHFSGSLFDSSAAEGDAAPPPADLPTDLVTVNAEGVDFARDMYGPWLVMTNDLQGELFVDHDAFVFYRPANGLGYGVGKMEVLDAKKAGTAFTLRLETYAYQATTSFAPRSGVTLEATGMVKKVSSPTTQYETFSLMGIFRKEDPNTKEEHAGAGRTTTKEEGQGEEDELSTGQFNAAKLSPWTPSEKDLPWQPSKELQQIFREVFPQPLRLTSHLTRREALAKQAAAATGPDSRRSSSKHRAFHMNLEPYRIGSVRDMYYIPNYISEEEEAQIVALVRNTPAELKSKVTKRTVQEWGCTMCSECEKSFVSDANMPPWVQECTDMLMYDGIATPSTFLNSVRIHEYEQGEGIGPHCDGPIYVPCVTVLSLASTSVMGFYPKQDPYLDQPMEHYNDTFKFSEGRIGAQVPIMSVVLEPRSLLVFADAAYYYYPHGVSDRAVDDLSPEVAGEVINRHLLVDKDVLSVARKYRVSLTTRNLLTRCNHQPARTEYNMKRAWYLYNQLPIPTPLFTTPPAVLATTTAAESTGAQQAAKSPDEHGLSASQLAAWDARMDQVFANQEEMKRSLQELKELVTMTVAADAQFRKDTSTILGSLTTTLLDVDAKVEDLRDDLEGLSQRN